MVKVIASEHEKIGHEKELHMLEDLCILDNDVLYGLPYRRHVYP
jgi:hypothetical protein